MTQQAVFFSAGRNVAAMNRLKGCRYWSYAIPDIKTPLVGDNAVRSCSIYYLAKGRLQACPGPGGRLLRELLRDRLQHWETGLVEIHRH
jgi:hypothetical protein